MLGRNLENLGVVNISVLFDISEPEPDRDPDMIMKDNQHHEKAKNIYGDDTESSGM